MNNVDKAVNLIRANIAQFLSSKRKEKDISIRELNRLSGVSTAVISDLENCKALPSIEIIVKLAFALDIEFENLIYAFAKGNTNIKFAESKPIDEMAELRSILYRKGLSSPQIADVVMFIKFIEYTSHVRKVKNNN